MCIRDRYRTTAPHTGTVGTVVGGRGHIGSHCDLCTWYRMWMVRVQVMRMMVHCSCTPWYHWLLL